MAISKTQNERPAIIALIDAVNVDESTLGEHTQAIAGLTQGLEAETRDRIAEDQNLTRYLSATNTQIGLLTDEVDGLTGDVAGIQQDISSLQASIAAQGSLIEALQLWQLDVNAFMSDFRIGETATITVPANDSYSSSETFATPFAADDDCIIMLQVITGELSTLFDVTLIDCTYSSFSYQITNSDTDSHDVKLGYVAVRTNRE